VDGTRADCTVHRSREECRRRVVVIGTDIPDLGPKELEEAYRALDSSDVVVGPAADGGYYLLGTSTLIPALFEDIPWSTHEVFARTMRNAALLGLSVHLLDTLSDIDTPQDLLAWQARAR
jgi:uncharacterized protein